jgi:hypothetical protein
VHRVYTCHTINSWCVKQHLVKRIAGFGIKGVYNQARVLEAYSRLYIKLNGVCFSVGRWRFRVEDQPSKSGLGRFDDCQIDLLALGNVTAVLEFLNQVLRFAVVLPEIRSCSFCELVASKKFTLPESWNKELVLNYPL